jgi:diphthine methyl ester synthase
MVFFTDSWRPDSFYDRLVENTSLGLHSLILLDIKVKEPDLDHLARTGRYKYDPPRYMSVAQCCQQMVEVEDNRKQGICVKNKLVVGAARVGSAEMKIVAGTLEELCEVDMGEPLHSVVLVGKRCHDVEREILSGVAVNEQTFAKAWLEGGYGL